jgi:ribonuclease PH
MKYLFREGNRNFSELRPIQIVPGYSFYPEGSCLFSIGRTQVLCNLTIEEGVPRWMQLQNKPGGWITAEYSLLPRSTQQRTPRETTPGGRTMEIRRLIGRSLRAAIDLEKIGPYTLTVDCDVIQADGGTRTASITGGFIAMMLGVQKYIQAGKIPEDVCLTKIAAISVGMVDGICCLDLDYSEDNRAEVDANIVMTSAGNFVELQVTAEKKTFTRKNWNDLLELAEQGIKELHKIQTDLLPFIKFREE